TSNSVSRKTPPYSPGKYRLTTPSHAGPAHLPRRNAFIFTERSVASSLSIQTKPRPWPHASLALDVNDLPQRVPDLHQVSGVRHDLVNIFVRAGDLVEERVRMAP